jgi:hypothetical protein
MTPAAPTSKLPGVVVFLLSFLLGSGCVGMVGGVVGWVFAKRAEFDARRGWNLVPVVVAAKDLPPGTRVTVELVSQRSVPEQFVTDSVVSPERIGDVLGSPVISPVSAGEPLRWSLLSTIPDAPAGENADTFDACAQEVSSRWAADLDQTPGAQRRRVQEGP